MKRWGAIGVIGVLQVLDLCSTQLALSIPGAVELNPLVHSLGLWPAKLLVIFLLIVLVLKAKKTWHLWALAGIYGAIVVSNFTLFFLHS